MTTTNQTAPLALRYFAADLLSDAAAHGTRFGTSKVFLSTIPGVDLSDPECVRILQDLRRHGLVKFARADLVSAMDPALVKASSWTERMGRLVLETHFVELPDTLLSTTNVA